MDSTIRNIILEDCGVAGNFYVGSIVGWNNRGAVSECSSTGQVTGSNSQVGGLIGTINRGSVSSFNFTGEALTGRLIGKGDGTAVVSCFFIGNVVSSNDIVGGLIGSSATYKGTTTSCHASGQVSGGGTVGGLIGYNASTVTSSYANVDLTGIANAIGGLLGANLGGVRSCFATGDVTGGVGHSIGGLVGKHDTADLTSSYATGDVTGNQYVGGLVGFAESRGHLTCTISSCFSAGAVQSNNIVGGLLGFTYEAPFEGTIDLSYWETQPSGQASRVGGTGLTSEPMFFEASYAGFDFTTNPDWTIY